MSDAERVLELVAAHVLKEVFAYKKPNDIGAVLKRRLLPLLEAGRALTMGYGHTGHWDSTMQHGAGCLRCIEQRKLREAWDAALDSALKEQK